MAANITSPGAWNYQSMKPDADEEVVALWGQNMADNDGYLYYREQTVGNYNGRRFHDVDNGVNMNNFLYQKTHFIKQAQHDKINGTVYTSWTTTGAPAAKGTITISIDGVQAYQKKFAANNTDDTESFSYDTSSMSDGATGSVTYLYSNSEGQIGAGETGAFDLSVSLWSAI